MTKKKMDTIATHKESTYNNKSNNQKEAQMESKKIPSATDIKLGHKMYNKSKYNKRNDTGASSSLVTKQKRVETCLQRNLNTYNIPMIGNINPEWERTKQEHKQKWINYQKAIKNNSNKENWPICEACNEVCYASNRATKLVCQNNKLNYCNKCYRKLPLLDKIYNRRKCPNHHQCVAFESQVDRKRYNNLEWEDQDYFTDYTKCQNHPNVTLIPEQHTDGLCKYCDRGIKETIDRAWDDYHTNLYQVAAIVATRYVQQHLPQYEEVEGKLWDAFHLPLTKRQQTFRKNTEEWAQQKEVAEKQLDNLITKIPQDHRWIVNKIQEEREGLVMELGYFKYKNPAICKGCLALEEGETPLKICDKCKRQHPRDRPIQPPRRKKNSQGWRQRIRR